MASSRDKGTTTRILRFGMLIVLTISGRVAGEPCSQSEKCEHETVPLEVQFPLDSKLGSNVKSILESAESLRNLGISVLGVSRSGDWVLVGLDPQIWRGFMEYRKPQLHEDFARRQLQLLLQTALKDIGRVGRPQNNYYVKATAGYDCGAVPSMDWARTRIGLAGVPDLSNTESNENVRVAVIDSGLATSLGAFSGALWRNLDEDPNFPADDRDRNQIFGDIYGASFHHGKKSAEIRPKTSHGTLVAGIIAARAGDRPRGIAQSSEVMTLRILGEDNRGTTADAADAVDYAINKGAQIINMSWATTCNDPRLEQKIKEASDQGILLVSSVGNADSVPERDNDVCPAYPASFRSPTTISVGATALDGCAWSLTRHGVETVDVGAPGEDVLSTDTDGTCVTFTGTSAAAPVVTGIAALMVRHTESWNWARRRQYLLDSAKIETRSCGLKSITRGVVNAARATSPPAEFTWPPWKITVPSGQSLTTTWRRLFDTVECEEVDVLLSVDGGATFPTKLNSSAAIDIDSPAFTSVLPETGEVEKAKLRLRCHDTPTLTIDSNTFSIEP